MNDVDDSDDGPSADEQGRAAERISACSVLQEAARDGDGAAALWLLERTNWGAWGPWHQKCAPNLLPAAPLRIKTPAARRAAHFLERSSPADWCRRCRYCGRRL